MGQRRHRLLATIAAAAVVGASTIVFAPVAFAAAVNDLDTGCGTR